MPSQRTPTEIANPGIPRPKLFVPSTGSMTQTKRAPSRSRLFAVPSSPRMPSAGNAPAISSSSHDSIATSASVTIESSAFQVASARSK